MSQPHALHDVLFPKVDAALAEANAESTLGYFRPMMSADEWSALATAVAEGVPDVTMSHSSDQRVRRIREEELVQEVWDSGFEYRDRRRAVAAILLNVLRRDGTRLLHKLTTSALVAAPLRTWARKILTTPRRRKAVAYAVLTLLDALEWNLAHLMPTTGMSAMDMEQRAYRARHEDLEHKPEHWVYNLEYTRNRKEKAYAGRTKLLFEQHAHDDAVLVALQDTEVWMHASDTVSVRSVDARGLHRPTSIGRRTKRWAWCPRCEQYFQTPVSTPKYTAQCPLALAEVGYEDYCFETEVEPPTRTKSAVEFRRTKMGKHTVYSTFTKGKRGWVFVCRTVAGNRPIYVHQVVSTEISHKLDCARSERFKAKR